jgi:glycosyltransferase involved in cell wall biosynthesis
MTAFSIILPVRNGGEYVKECIHSILAQTYPNFNLIVLDNNSTDGTREWISSLHHEKIFIIPSQKDLTIEENWGRIKGISKHEFITLIGHDDLLMPNFLEEMNKLVKLHPDAGLYHTHFNYIDATGKLIRQCKKMPSKLDKFEYIESFLNIEIDLMGTGYVMRASEYDKLGGIPLNYPSLLFADFELWLNLTSVSYEAISPLSCFAFRLHDSTTSLSSNQKMMKAFEVFINYLIQISATDEKVNKVIQANAISFIKFYAQGLSFRILKTPIRNRTKQDTVKSLQLRFEILTARLTPINNHKNFENLFFKVARIIDSNHITRGLFLLFKKIVRKPILK